MWKETASQLNQCLPAGEGLSAAFCIQAAVGKWQGCDVNRSGKFFQRLLLRGARVGGSLSEENGEASYITAPTSSWSCEFNHIWLL